MPPDQPRVIEGDLSVRDLRIACVAARFNDFVVESLMRGALELAAALRARELSAVELLDACLAAVDELDTQAELY